LPWQRRFHPLFFFSPAALNFTLSLAWFNFFLFSVIAAGISQQNSESVLVRTNNRFVFVAYFLLRLILVDFSNENWEVAVIVLVAPLAMLHWHVALPR
jgi:hypothetical protein